MHCCRREVERTCQRIGDIGLTAQINTGRTPERFEINRVFVGPIVWWEF